MTLTFTRVADPSLTYTVQAESDLVTGTWATVWSSSGGSNTAGSVTVEDNVLIGGPGHSKRFLQLEVTH